MGRRRGEVERDDEMWMRKGREKEVVTAAAVVEGGCRQKLRFHAQHLFLHYNSTHAA